MGDRRKRALRVQFDGKLRVEFHGASITSDAELLPFREMDKAFRLTETAAMLLAESRAGRNTQHTLLALLRQAVYARLAGYEDVNMPSACTPIPRCGTSSQAEPRRRKPPQPAR